MRSRWRGLVALPARSAGSPNPGWEYYRFPWGYTIPTAPYSHPAIMNCLQRRPVPRPGASAVANTGPADAHDGGLDKHLRLRRLSLAAIAYMDVRENAIEVSSR